MHVVPLASGWIDELANEARPRERTPRRLGYVGQLYPLQGVDFLLQVLGLLPEHSLTIVGGKPAEVEWLSSEAVRCGVRERVTTLGYVDPKEVRRAIEDVDILLLPSRPHDRMPYVAHTKAFEYLAFERPIVAADLPSLREELGTDGAAILVPPEDPYFWANAIRRIEEDGALLRRMVDTARRRARAFTWEERARRMLAAFQAAHSARAA